MNPPILLLIVLGGVGVLVATVYAIGAIIAAVGVLLGLLAKTYEQLMERLEQL